MDVPDDVGAGVVEDLVAALEPGEVVERQVGVLQHRAHGTVRDDDTLGERVEQRCVVAVGETVRVLCGHADKVSRAVTPARSAVG